jgi:hypothetical protein
MVVMAAVAVAVHVHLHHGGGGSSSGSNRVAHVGIVMVVAAAVVADRQTE